MNKVSAICRQWRVDQPLIGLVSNARGTFCVAAVGDGQLLIVPSDDAGEDPKFIQAHDGISLELAADADAHGMISCGDDGRVFLVDPGMAAPTMLVEHKGKWVDHVTGEASGHRAYAVGKMLYRLNESGEEVAPPFAMPSSIGGLSFSPNGKRLAVSHYNGVHLFWTNAPETEPDILEWKGSHLNMMWSPDNSFLVTAMQDNSLHGWKMGAALKSQEAGNEMHMQGYQAKVHSMGFTAKGKYLATSGAEQIVCWPFFDGGPWNKQPLTLGGSEGRLVSRVAPHPRDEMVAAGFEDGMIILAPLDGRLEVMINEPVAAKGAGVIGLSWNGEGDALVAALENGHIMLFTLASISRFVRGRFA